MAILSRQNGQEMKRENAVQDASPDKSVSVDGRNCS